MNNSENVLQHWKNLKLDQIGKLTKEDRFALYLQGDSNVYLDNGEIKVLALKKKAQQDTVIIDWLNFTCDEESYNHSLCITDDDVIQNASAILEKIFGFSITAQRETGSHYYKRSYIIGDQFGILGHGGQRGTILVSLSATALTHASEGWENRLYQFLNSAINAKITRLDLAHDIYDAAPDLIHTYFDLYKDGGFTNHRVAPSVELLGDWINEKHDGRTLKIGKRTSGLMARIYEKGFESNSKDYPWWLRIEVEIKSVDRLIPFEALLSPHSYFAGAYPCLAKYASETTKAEIFKKEVKADIEHRVFYAKQQAGAVIKMLTDLGYSHDEVIDQLKRDVLPRKFEQKFVPKQLIGIHEPDSYHVPTFDDAINSFT